MKKRPPDPNSVRGQVAGSAPSNNTRARCGGAHTNPLRSRNGTKTSHSPEVALFLTRFPSASLPPGKGVSAPSESTRCPPGSSDVRAPGRWPAARNTSPPPHPAGLEAAESQDARQPRAITTPSPVQFSSVAQSCPTLCDPMNRSTPGLPVHHQLPEFTQTHSIESVMPSSHLILCPSPPAPNPSQHQSLFP